MSAQAYSFITVAEMKSHLDISETTWDTILEDLIDQCTKMIQNYCGGRQFLKPSGDVTEYYDGTDSESIYLRSWPIASITSVSYRSGTFGTPVWVNFNSDYDYLRNDDLGILSFPSLPRGKKNIRVIYKGGYATAADVPDDLHLAVRKLVAKEFGRRKSQGVLSESVGGASVTWNEELDPGLKAILDNYRSLL